VSPYTDGPEKPSKIRVFRHRDAPPRRHFRANPLCSGPILELAMPGLTLTPEMLEGAYEYLRVSPPFCHWGLPHADHVSFRVLGAKDRFGHFRGRHRKA
jgi:hypothetical protein